MEGRDVVELTFERNKRARKDWVNPPCMVHMCKTDAGWGLGSLCPDHGVEVSKHVNELLWIVSQPMGQRPADLVVYARRLLGRYGSDAEQAQYAAEPAWPTTNTEGAA